LNVKNLKRAEAMGAQLSLEDWRRFFGKGFDRMLRKTEHKRNRKKFDEENSSLSLCFLFEEYLGFPRMALPTLGASNRHHQK
jgi:hypothetical protein